mgnify:CR=1 FL=1
MRCHHLSPRGTVRRHQLVLACALALGAGADPLSGRELRYATEQDTVVLPTFATVAQNFHATEPPKVSFPGVDIDLAKVVHGSQQVAAARPLPASGSATSRTVPSPPATRMRRTPAATASRAICTPGSSSSVSST